MRGPGHSVMLSSGQWLQNSPERSVLSDHEEGLGSRSHSAWSRSLLTHPGHPRGRTGVSSGFLT